MINLKRKNKEVTKKKKVPTIKVGTHKKLTIALWVVLIFSVCFGVYKNFTAIDIHTIHEKEIIEKQIVDTSKVESFTQSFATEYFSWEQPQKAIEERNERLKNYLTETLHQLNIDMIRTDIPTSSIVQKVQIWSISQQDNIFDVIFSVDQMITENEEKTSITSTYIVSIYVEDNGNMIVIKNPTMNSKPQKSSYEPKPTESDGTIDAITSDEINEFLETFFKLYPSATEKELAYYVSNNALPVVSKDYVFVELINPVYVKVDSQVKAVVTVKYLDQETKTTQFSQYELVLQKQDNWKIVR